MSVDDVRSAMVTDQEVATMTDCHQRIKKVLDEDDIPLLSRSDVELDEKSAIAVPIVASVKNRFERIHANLKAVAYVIIHDFIVLLLMPVNLIPDGNRRCTFVMCFVL